MIAAPGGGKGTQDEWLAAKFSVQHGMTRAGQRTRLD
jgi:adenylate kinase family enzyme